jgi:formate hydrogenlyase subunit 3/multisubunit Na+/H+ antiporter MnhD subunit
MTNIILLPFIAGTFCFIIPRLREVIAILSSLAVSIMAFILFINRPSNTEWLAYGNLNGFILIGIGIFGLLISMYSLRFMKGKDRLNEYYAYLLWTLGAACGAVLSNNLYILLAFWGFSGFTLYMLIGLGNPESAVSAKKTLIIVGGTDAILAMGFAIIHLISDKTTIDTISISATSTLAITAFIFVSIAAFAKAGAMPFHTWIPDSAENAPLPVMAYLPAALDKLLGIYLLARISMDMFVIGAGSFISIFLLVIGAVTIVAAVMMALVQHNAKKLLSYHAISQVGYMVLGIGTGNPIGIAGGLFHMLNNAIYKSCLFLTTGHVEHKTGTTELDRLGGLAKALPITFFAFLVAAFSISGIPPFNGFISKWMIYQGIIHLNDQGNLWIVLLIVAMFGSSLTLASFMKLIHAIFLGQGSSTKTEKAGKITFSMWLPTVILSGLCIIFGIFAHQIPLKYFIQPAVKGLDISNTAWNPELATVLILVGLLIGLIIYSLGSAKKVRVDASFIGGEKLSNDVRVTGADFYTTITDIKSLSKVYKLAKDRTFDIYDIARSITKGSVSFLKKIQTGLLSDYLMWYFIGIFGLLAAFIFSFC